MPMGPPRASFRSNFRKKIILNFLTTYFGTHFFFFYKQQIIKWTHVNLYTYTLLWFLIINILQYFTDVTLACEDGKQVKCSQSNPLHIQFIINVHLCILEGHPKSKVSHEGIW